MRTILLAVVVVATAASSFGQIYGARRYTQRIAPQLPPPPQQQQVPQPQQPQQAPPQQQQQQNQQYNYQYSGAYPQYQYAATPSRPVDPVKAAAEKAKNEEKQFEYFKHRAEEGSDHAQYEVGVRYLAGKGVAPDEKLGREWLEKASKNGYSQATKKLAELNAGAEPDKAAPAAISQASAKPPETKAAEPKAAEPKAPEAK
jgi:TPR repeat protein